MFLLRLTLAVTGLAVKLTINTVIYCNINRELKITKINGHKTENRDAYNTKADPAKQTPWSCFVIRDFEVKNP